MSESEQQSVISALASTVEEIRHQAVRRIPEVFSSVPVGLLLCALGDNSWRVRKLAAETLVAGGSDPTVIEALVKSLGDETNAGLRNSATEALIRIGSPAVVALCELLKHGSKDERKFAADIMGVIADRRSLGPLMEQLDDPEDNVRAAVAEALGAFRDESVLQKIVEALRKDSLVVQLSCLGALDRMGVDSLPYELLDSLLTVGPLRPYTYRLLGGLRDPRVIPALLQGLRARGRVERAAAARALARQYHLSDKQEQIEIRMAVGHRGDDEIANNLRGMLTNPESDVREAAVVMLGWTGRLDVVPDLIRAAPDQQLHDIVFDALLSIGPRCADILCGLMEELGKTEKIMAIELLGHFAQPASLPVMVDLCSCEDQDVAQAAQRATGQVGNPTVIPMLVGLIKRDPDLLPAGAVGSLIELGGGFHDEVLAAVAPLLSADRPSMRVAAAEIICGVARKTDLEFVYHLIGDQDSEVRAAAVRALGRVGDGATVERLGMAMTDEVPRVRAAAARVLGNREEPEARAILRVALGDKDFAVVREVLIALGQSGDESAMVMIQPFIQHRDGLVALEAVRALNKLDWKGDLSLVNQVIRQGDSEVIKELLAGCLRWPASDMRQVLLGLLDHPRWDVRVAAAKKIGESQDSPSLQGLYQKVAFEKNDLVKSAMEQAIGRKDDNGRHSR